MKDAKSGDGGQPWTRGAGIAAVFAVTGPLAGLLAFLVWFCLLTLASPTPTSSGDLAEGAMSLLRLALVGLIFGLPGAYLIGFPAAVAVGVAVALWDRWCGVISWQVAVAAAVGIWLVPLPFRGDQIATGGLGLSRTTGLLPAYLGGAIICAWAARRLFGPVGSARDD